MEDVTLKDDARVILAHLSQLRVVDESQKLNETFVEKEARGMSEDKTLRKIPAIILCQN